MIRLALLAVAIVAFVNGAAIKEDLEVVRGQGLVMAEQTDLHSSVRSKRSYVLESDWSRVLRPTTNVPGVNVCADWTAIQTHDAERFKAALLSEHARVREEYNALVARKGCANMAVENTQLEWDDDLARLAQLWANMCTTGHGYHYTQCNGEPNARSYGQNVMFSSQSYTRALAVMQEGFVYTIEQQEKRYTSVCTDRCLQGRTCGHYLQLVERRTARVGCAFTDPAHKCQEMYYQDSRTDGKQLLYRWPFQWAMYVCVYDQHNF